MTSLRVLASAFTCCPPGKAGFTGGESLLGWHLVGQIARFHQVWVLTQEDDKATVEQSLAQSVGGATSNIHFRYVRLPFVFRPLLHVQGGHQIYYYLWQIMAYFAARKLHREHDFDLFHHVTYANDWMASFIGALLPVPYVRGPGGGAQRTPKGFLRLYSFKGRLWERLRSAGQWFFRHDPFFILGQRRAKAILVCNPEAFNALPGRWQDKALMFSVNGISADDLSKFPRNSHSSSTFQVLSAGKLIPIKGFQLGIDTFTAFAAKHPEARFTIVGDGPDLQQLESMVRRSGLADNVKFAGWIPREELLAKMASADVFLFPALRDGGGEVVVEAMSMGKPVVCLELGGPAMHITDEIGIKIAATSPKRSVQGMADALERLYLDRELRDTMGRAARERAMDIYHWDRAGERLADIYQQTISARTKP